MSDRMKRTLVIETEIDRKKLGDSERLVQNFFNKYEDKRMKVETPDFQEILNPIREIESEIDRVTEKMPHMLGSISVDKRFLADVREAFQEIEVKFTDGSTAKGFDAIMEKTKTLSLHAVDLGEYLKTVQSQTQGTVDSLKELGAIEHFLGRDYLNLGGLNTTQLESAIRLMHELQEAQSKLDDFSGQPLKSEDFYSNTSTKELAGKIRQAETDLDELKQLNLQTVQELRNRKNIMSNIDNQAGGKYSQWEFDDIKDSIKEDEAQYDIAIGNLRKYIANRNELMNQLQDNSHLFTSSELNGYKNTLTDDINNANLQIQELQQISGKVADVPIGGNFDEVVRVLNEIKVSLGDISRVFQDTESSMRGMAESSKTSFEGLAGTIKSVYDNLTQIQALVDTISKKDFNITNITNPTPTSTSTSKRATVKQLKSEVEAEMQHVKALYTEIDTLITQLQQKGSGGSNSLRQLLGVLGDLDDPTYENFEESILGKMADAKTKVKIENLLVVLDGYIDKLTAINKLREQYGLGEWQDPFTKPAQPTSKPIAQQKPQVVETPTVTQPQNTVATTNSEAQHMYQLKAAIDEVSNAIGRKNAGFVKEAEIVSTSVKKEEDKLRELVSVITTEIGNALDGIKEKFTQSFAIPEINKGGLQESLNGIYAEFTTLQKNIQDLKISIGVGAVTIPQESSVIDSAVNTEKAVDGETQSAKDVDKSFTDATNAKKEFTEANKNVAKSAKESAKAVEEETEAAKKAKETMMAVADDTELLTDWDKEIKLQEGHNEDPFAVSRSKTDNVGNESIRTIVETWSLAKDEDGELTGKMELNTVKIINDYKKRTDAITKENEKIKTAQAYLQKFLTQFDNKTMGQGKMLNGYQALEKLANRDNNDPNSEKFTIDDISRAEQMMSNLDAEYNKVVQSMRKGSSSMNPFVNAINSMGKMEDVLRGVYLQFQTLKQQPEWLKNQIIDLYKQFDNVSAESDIYKFAEGFGNLKVSINSVTESIRQQRTEQKLATADFNALIKATKTRDTNTEKAAKEEDGSVWKTYYMDRAAEQQKIIDAIRIGLVLTEDQEAQLNAMSEKHALIINDITRENNKIEEQKQKYEEIMRLLEKNHADQIELDNDTSLDAGDRKAYQQILNEERAEIDALIANTDLNPEQTKSVKQFRGSIEDDRIAKVKEYINLLRLQQDYEKKATKEQDGSKMQSFYNDQIVKVKEKLNQIDITAIENQDEKNKRLAIEEAHQRAIAEIQEKKNANVKSVMPFDSEDSKIQKKYEAGYLSDGLYNDWQKELAEYRNYISGVTEADETMIQSKKQSLMQMYDGLTKMSNASKSFFASGGEMLPTWLTPEQMNNTKQSLMDLYNSISAERFEGMKTSVTGVSEKLGKLTFVVDDGKGSLTQYTLALDKASGATKLLDNSTKPTLTTLQRFGQHLKKDFTGVLHAIIGGSGVHAFVRYIREGVQAVRELDLALTELKKVTDATEETYDKFLETAAETSSRIGRTITDMTSATAEFAKLGYDINTAAAMAESALVYANVGDNVDVETGSQSIISTMKAFGIEANNTMSIVDKFNEVGNNFAITTKGIGDALQVSASAMAEAGNTLDETIALTTAANTIVQNPNTVGTALKTLSLRIRGVKTE